MENKCETSFKVGDKVKLVASAYPDGSALCARQGASFTIKEAKEVFASKFAGWDDGSGIYSIDRCWVTGSMLEALPTTPKSMLKDFMRVETMDGTRYIVCDDIFVGSTGFTSLDGYSDYLTDDGGHKRLDVTHIYEKSPNKWEALDELSVGTLIWQRESPEDIAKKNKRFDLVASMKTLQTELDVMKKALEEME